MCQRLLDEMAAIAAAGRVIIIDQIDYRLEFARTYCPCEAYNFKELDDPVLFAKKTTDWLGADVCIDAVGAPYWSATTSIPARSFARRNIVFGKFAPCRPNTQPVRKTRWRAPLARMRSSPSSLVRP